MYLASRLAITALGIAIAVAGCSKALVTRSTVSDDGSGFRTYTVVSEVDGVPVSCGAYLASPPRLLGTLHGDPTNHSEPVWLTGDGGSHLSMIFPAGFSIEFDPSLVLRDSQGHVKAREGDHLEFNQSLKDHQGTFEDPFPAEWFMGDNNCSLFKP